MPIILLILSYRDGSMSAPSKSIPRPWSYGLIIFDWVTLRRRRRSLRYLQIRIESS